MNDGAQEPARPAQPDIAVWRAGRTGWIAGVPRWVKVFVITTLMLVLLMVVVMLLSGGHHGPGRHRSSVGFEGASAQVMPIMLMTADGTSALSSGR